jgi:hypothetical protein
MSLIQYGELSLENINFSKNDNFFSDLIMEVKRLRRDFKEVFPKRVNPEKPEDSGFFSKIIKKHTNLTVPMSFLPIEYGYNAAVQPPQFDKNHPLYDPARKKHFTSKDSEKLLKKGLVSGSVNLQTGKVSGTWTEIDHWLFITPNIITNSYFTDEELAAIILHEVGHLITYYIFLGRFLTCNHAMHEINSRWNDSISYDHKVKIIEHVNKSISGMALDPDSLAEVKNSETVTSMVVSQFANAPMSASGTSGFDYRSWEALSDQYAVRNNAALAIASGVAKVEKMGGNSSYWSDGKHFIMNLFTLPILIISLPMVILMMLMNKPYDTYDPPGERISRIRREAINAIKDTKMSKTQRRQYSDDMEQIQLLIDETNDKDSWFMFMWKTVIPSVRNEGKDISLLKDLELLANNELYVAANKLNSL